MKKVIQLDLTAKILIPKKAVNMKIIKHFFLISLFLIIFQADLNPALAVSCSDTKPEKAPELFQIDVTKTTAKLFFTPVNNAITNYTIIYGLERGRDDFGVSFPFGKYEGVIDYTINDLSPNTKYYFRVRADNGCRTGWTSDSMSVSTNWDFKTYSKYKDQSKTTIDEAIKLPEKVELPTEIITKTIEKKLPPQTTISPKESSEKNDLVVFFQDIFNKVTSFFNSSQ